MPDATRPDVLVIGAGLAGITAALRCRQLGARVAVASRGFGATAMSTGALDIAFAPAFVPGGGESLTLRAHIADIIQHRRRHPYGVMGQARTEAGIAEGFEVLRRAWGDDSVLPTIGLDGQNQLLPSSLGAALPAAAHFGGHGPLTGDDWGILELTGFAQFDVDRVIRGIDSDLTRFGAPSPSRWHKVTVQGPAVQGGMAVAASLDQAEAIEQLADELRRHLSGVAGVLVPPVIGLRHATRRREQLSRELGVPVFEALGHLPSVPGFRLQTQLLAILKAAGIPQLGEVTAVTTAGDRVSSAWVGEDEVLPETVILATGGFVAGGLRWDDRCHEPLFDLPLVTEVGQLEVLSPHKVVRPTPVESHPLMTAGVWVDETMRPMAEGRVAYHNLFAAGMVLGGFASRYALCADGVALASGWHAANGASGAAS